MLFSKVLPFLVVLVRSAVKELAFHDESREFLKVVVNSVLLQIWLDERKLLEEVKGGNDDGWSVALDEDDLARVTEREVARRHMSVRRLDQSVKRGASSRLLVKVFRVGVELDRHPRRLLWQQAFEPRDPQRIQHRHHKMTARFRIS